MTLGTRKNRRTRARAAAAARGLSAPRAAGAATGRGQHVRRREGELPAARDRRVADDPLAVHTYTHTYIHTNTHTAHTAAHRHTAHIHVHTHSSTHNTTQHITCARRPPCCRSWAPWDRPRLRAAARGPTADQSHGAESGKRDRDRDSMEQRAVCRRRTGPCQLPADRSPPPPPPPPQGDQGPNLPAVGLGDLPSLRTVRTTAPAQPPSLLQPPPPQPRLLPPNGTTNTRPCAIGSETRVSTGGHSGVRDVTKSRSKERGEADTRNLDDTMQVSTPPARPPASPTGCVCCLSALSLSLSLSDAASVRRTRARARGN